MQPIKQHLQRLIESGYTQVEIEQKTTVTQATISRILNGESSDPRYSTVEKLRQLKPKPQRRKAVAASAVPREPVPA